MDDWLMTVAGGAGAHNWGVSTAEEPAIVAVDRNDPNYDSSEEGK
jgi:hypothetical protein